MSSTQVLQSLFLWSHLGFLSQVLKEYLEDHDSRDSEIMFTSLLPIPGERSQACCQSLAECLDEEGLRQAALNLANRLPSPMLQEILRERYLAEALSLSFCNQFD